MSLLNRSATKKFVLEHFKKRRAGPAMTRVSREYLDQLEAKLKNDIWCDIDRHRSVGKTFNP